jgi:hypothetical protein
MIFRRFFVILFVGIFASCSSVERIPLNYVGEDKGYLVLSLSATSKTNYSSYGLKFRSSNGKIGGIHYFQNMIGATKRDFDDQLSNGFVSVSSLPPGDYELFSFYVWENRGLSEVTWSPQREFSIPFTIKPNEAVYLGEYQAVGMTGKNLFGMTVPAGAYLVVQDKSKRDLKIASEKNSALPPKINVKVPNGLNSIPSIPKPVH